MSTLNTFVELTLPTNGTLDLYNSLDPLDSASQYVIVGSPTLIGNVTITSTNPNINVKNRRYEILWKANPDYDVYGIQIFGSNFTEERSSTGGNIVVYNDGSSNTINFYVNSQNGSSVKTVDIAPLAVDASRLGALAATTAKIDNNAITIPKIEASLALDTFAKTVSFESGQQGAYKMRFTYAIQLQSFKGQVVKALSGTDAGSIIASSSTGDMASNLSFPMSSAFGTELNADTSGSANNTIAANTDLIFTTAKPTAGGVVELTITYKRV